MSKLKRINLENGLNKCLFVAQIRNQDAKNRMATKADTILILSNGGKW